MKIKEKKKSKLKGPLKYIGMMGICCLLPIIAVFVLPLLGMNFRSISVLTMISSLICPIMMGLMMFGLLRGEKGSSCCKKEEAIEE